MSPKIDPITIEIVQNRLAQISREAGIAVQHTAGSSVVVEAKDLGFNIADNKGRTIIYSVWMPRHGTTLGHIIRSVMRRYDLADIHPGDMVMVNNPYDGALHLLDIAVVAPVFYKNQLVAWTGCATHHVDIGAVTPGFSPTARDWFQEGIKFPPVKIVEEGKMRQDLFDMFLLNVRTPLLQGLDLKAQIASNNVAGRKIEELVDGYGVSTIFACYDAMLDFSETKARSRIEALPKGSFEVADCIDFDRHYAVKCRLTVDDAGLTFDFTGTEEQSSTFFNCAFPCTEASVHNIVLCMLFSDIPANEGCLRPIKVIAPEGTIFNCKVPAPCSGASVTSSWKVQNLTISVLSKALADSAERDRVVSGWGCGPTIPQFSGVGRNGKYFSVMLVDSVMQGSGARATKDGVDAGASVAGSTNSSMANVETIEQRFPLLYLQRGYVTDSEGAGKFRGGLGGEFAVVPYETDRVETTVFYLGKDVVPQGMWGGHPGSSAMIKVKRKSDIWQASRNVSASYQNLKGKEEVVGTHSDQIYLGRGDVFYARTQGGAGLGDPQQRDKSLVARDLKRGLISSGKARDVYGLTAASEKAGRQNRPKTEGKKRRP